MITPKKKFGQNFLKDETILYKIIQSMPHNDNTVVEIGPGLGDLTQKLLECKKRVIAFEVDKDLYRLLEKKFCKEIEKKTLTLYCTDIIERWNKVRLIEESYILAANLPYYAATNIVLKALKDPNCKNITVMVQKEVAKKFAAKPKERDFSALSILANSICDTEILFDVEAEKFDPPPKVTSSVLQMVKTKQFIKEKDDGIFSSCEELTKFENFLKEAFRAPRKTLIKNLSLRYNKNMIKEFYEKEKIPHNIRPHEFSLSLYHLLFKKLV